MPFTVEHGNLLLVTPMPCKNQGCPRQSLDELELMRLTAQQLRQTEYPSEITSKLGSFVTPMECERLMGFSDNYTNIPGASDTARYKALGNSMAVPCMRWIAQRMAKVDKQIA